MDDKLASRCERKYLGRQLKMDPVEAREVSGLFSRPFTSWQCSKEMMRE